MALLYSDENFPQPVVEELRRSGHDVLTSHEAGQSGRAVPDDAVLAFALAHGRAVLTLNRKHFRALHRTNPGHAGIIVCTFDPDFAGQAARIDEAVALMTELDGCVLKVN